MKLYIWLTMNAGLHTISRQQRRQHILNSQRRPASQSSASVIRLNAESEQTYAHQLEKIKQATKEVQQVVAGMKTALQVARSQSLPTEDLQATK